MYHVQASIALILVACMIWSEVNLVHFPEQVFKNHPGSQRVALLEQ